MLSHFANREICEHNDVVKTLTPIGGGRRQGMTKEAEQKAILAETYYKEGKMGVNQIALEIGVAKMTLYKYLRHRKVVIGSYTRV